MQRDISDQHLATLRQMCGLAGNVPVPQKVVNRYWENKIVCDRVGKQIELEFVRICVECGFGKLTEAELNPDVATLWYRGEVKANTDVLVLWREKQIPAKLVSINARRECTVLMEGEQRTVAPEIITLAAKAA